MPMSPLALAAALGLAWLAASGPACAADGSRPRQVEVGTGSSHEQCALLRSDQELWYSFRSSGALDFNIHYHRGAGVRYAVDLRARASHEGTFRPPRTEVYCLMWENAIGPAVSLSYQFRVQGSPGPAAPMR
jgi:hypothetical protein